MSPKLPAVTGKDLKPKTLRGIIEDWGVSSEAFQEMRELGESRARSADLRFSGLRLVIRRD